MASHYCKIINICKTTPYEKKHDLTNIWSANIRSMFTKMRIDANCTLDSRLRSFKHNKTEDAMCKECNAHQYSSVSDVLLECNNLELMKNRDVLNDKLSKYVQHFPSVSEQEKLKTILNLKPLCKKEVEEDVCKLFVPLLRSLMILCNASHSDMNVLLTLVK